MIQIKITKPVKKSLGKRPQRGKMFKSLYLNRGFSRRARTPKLAAHGGHLGTSSSGALRTNYIITWLRHVCMINL